VDRRLGAQPPPDGEGVAFGEELGAREVDLVERGEAVMGVTWDTD